MGKRVMVTLTDEQYEILGQMREFGNTDAERLRNVFLAFASEKNYLKRWREERA